MAKVTEQEILEIARKHFVRKGFAGARMQEIADEAGINKAMLHYYFRSKDKLYHEIIKQTLNFMIPKLANAISQEGNFWEKIERLINTYIDTLTEHPDIPFFIIAELSQKRERFIEELKNKSSHFPAAQKFVMEMMNEMAQGNIKEFPPIHLFLNIVGMTVFPFMAKPVFQTIFEVSEKDFEQLMQLRKKVILDFVKSALKTD
ncbi:MAG: TetR/AcrR family transcriptional regulator [Saprospiraceae bacterium]